jgi:hypothetical protein
VKYASSAAFRRALEDRLRAHSQKTALPLIRLRKLVAFDRLLARLTMEQPATWVLKGGLALQLRLGRQARTTTVFYFRPFHYTGRASPMIEIISCVVGRLGLIPSQLLVSEKQNGSSDYWMSRVVRNRVCVAFTTPRLGF